MKRLLLMAPLLLLLLGVALPVPAEAAIARNSATYTKCSANPCTVAHTVAGENPFLSVCVTWWHYLSTPTIIAHSWNGLPLTLAGTPVSNPTCGDKCSAAIYTLANPPAATANVSIEFSGPVNDATVGAVSYTGVAPLSPVGMPVPATGSGSPASVTVPSNSGEVVLDCLGSIASGFVPTPASGQTTNWAHLDINGYTYAASGYSAGMPSTVMAWAFTASPSWAMLAVPIKPAGGGGGGGTAPGTQRVISWTDNSDNESCVYLRWRTDESYPNWVDINSCLAPNTVSYPHNIGTQTGDCYQVAMTNAGGSSGFTSEVCAAGVPPPPPPTVDTVATPLLFDFEEDLL